MKQIGKLEFDLEDAEARRAFRRASNATKAYLALYHISEELMRNMSKYGAYNGRIIKDVETEIVEFIREQINDTLKCFNIDLDEDLS